MYCIVHNDKVKHTFENKEEAIKVVDSLVNETAIYYLNLNSVYTVNINVVDDIYTITGHYKFLNIELDTIFETFRVEKKINL